MPALLFVLQPTSTLDYESVDTREWLANCAPAASRRWPAPSPARGSQTDSVAGTIDDDPRACELIAAWLRAAGVALPAASAPRVHGPHLPGHARPVSRFHRRPAQLGAHVEVLEIDDLAARLDAVNEAEVAAKIEEIQAMFSFADPSTDPIAGPMTNEQLDWSARSLPPLTRWPTITISTGWLTTTRAPITSQNALALG